MCKFLIDHGAEANKKGGESVATPLQWAAQRCHYYVVDLLLSHGADPLATDSQGYNTMHIATFNGNVFLLVLLLHQGIPVDVADSYGHTGLMWSAYKGFPACVDVFLRWGADVDARDEQGFTALHWALVKGSAACVLKLIEYGSDRFAKTESGKTPAITARELNTVGPWQRALRESGYDPEGHTVVPPWPFIAGYFLQDRRAFVKKFMFLWPTVLVWAVVSVLAYMPIYAGLPLATAVAYGLMYPANEVLRHSPSDMRHFQRTVSLPLTPTLILGIADWCSRGSRAYSLARSSSSASTGSTPSSPSPHSHPVSPLPLPSPSSDDSSDFPTQPARPTGGSTSASPPASPSCATSTAAPWPTIRASSPR